MTTILPLGVTLLTGDCRAILLTLPAASVHCCVTSPPYWCLRDYGVDGQLGLEQTPDEYVSTMVDVFAEKWVSTGQRLSASAHPAPARRLIPYRAPSSIRSRCGHDADGGRPAAASRYRHRAESRLCRDGRAAACK